MADLQQEPSIEREHSRCKDKEMVVGSQQLAYTGPEAKDESCEVRQGRDWFK